MTDPPPFVDQGQERDGYRLIVEGRCPTCDHPLERQDKCGWCAHCGVGWSYQSTGPKTATVRLHIIPRFPKSEGTKP